MHYAKSETIIYTHQTRIMYKQDKKYERHKDKQDIYSQADINQHFTKHI